MDLDLKNNPAYEIKVIITRKDFQVAFIYGYDKITKGDEVRLLKETASKKVDNLYWQR